MTTTTDAKLRQKNILPPVHQRGGGSRMLSRMNIMSEIKVAVAKINY